MRAAANGIEIEYESLGDPAGRPLLLLRGLGTQMIQWAEGFRQDLVAAGHQLVTFDNRDVGLSTHLDGAPTPTIAELLEARASGQAPKVAYTLDDMADDVVGLMDALELPSAHVAGISMGGMIVQQVAARHPDRILSMTSIMSSTGNPGLPAATPAAQAALAEPPPRERAPYIEYSLRGHRVFTGPVFPVDEQEYRELAGRVYDRAFDPAGVSRQMAAVVASGDRRPQLAGITTSTLVIHGDADPLIPVDGGRDTAANIRGAALRIVAGMGHSLPTQVWDEVVAAIAEHTAQNSQ